jgi:hypothetical protein
MKLLGELAEQHRLAGHNDTDLFNALTMIAARAAIAMANLIDHYQPDNTDYSWCRACAHVDEYNGRRITSLEADHELIPFIPKIEPRVDGLPRRDARLLTERLGPDFANIIAKDPTVLDGLTKRVYGKHKPLFSPEKNLQIALCCRLETSAANRDHPSSAKLLDLLGACDVSRATARKVAANFDPTLTPFQPLFDGLLTFLQGWRFAHLLDPARADEDKALAFIHQCVETGRHSVFSEQEIVHYVYKNFGVGIVGTKPALRELVDLDVLKKIEKPRIKEFKLADAVVGMSVTFPKSGDGEILRFGKGPSGDDVAFVKLLNGERSTFSRLWVHHPETFYGPRPVVEAETVIAAFLSNNSRRELSEEDRSNIEWVIDNAALILGKPGFVPNEKQTEGLFRALEYKFTIINGLPGTGKTQLAALICAAAALIYPNENGGNVGFALLGRAASVLRKSAVWFKNGVAQLMTSGTIHRLFGLANIGEDGFTATQPVSCRIAFADEMSMNSSTLVAAFMGNLTAYHVIFIGDQFQLPPIGRGAPFRDMIASGKVPVTTLTQIYRTHSLGIQALCRDVLGGDISPEKINEYVKLGGVEYKPCDHGIRHFEAAEVFGDLFDHRFPTRDIKVLTSFNISEGGSRAINPLIRGALELPEDRLVVGDELICTTNNYEAPRPDAVNDDDVEIIFNGELCKIVNVGRDFVDIEFDDDDHDIRIVRFCTEDGSDAEGQLPKGFAIGHSFSVHKGQGSQVRAVIIPAEAGSGQFGIVQKGLIYTAASRAVDLLVIVGRFEDFVRAAKEPDPPRNTLLLDLLIKGRA